MTSQSFDAARYVSRVRRVADLSQRDLARNVGLGPATVARWETGQTSPRVTELMDVLAIAELQLQVVNAEGKVITPRGTSALGESLRLFGDVEFRGGPVQSDRA